MSELTLTVIRLGFLAILWAFVLTVAGVMRTDLFGQRVSRSTPVGPSPRAKTPKSQRPPKPAAAAKARRGSARLLVVVDGSLKGTEVTLGDTPITIGRAGDSTIVIDDDYASNRHAQLFPHEGVWVVEDLGSTNGTFLDRTRVSAPTVVPVGTPVRIGKTVFELRR